ncbi:MAG: hypothetical protein ACJ76D_09145 [Solirubrobacterales bacterium]
MKVCPRCAVASRTDAESCPNCGRRYQRRWQPLAIGLAIAALAFAAGYGGKLLLSDDGGGDSSAISSQLARAMPDGISRPQLIERLGGLTPTVAKPIPGAGTCLFYPLADHPDSAWQFCFTAGKLTSSGATGPGQSHP